MRLKSRKIILILFIVNCSLQIAVAQQPTLEWVRRYSPGANLSANGLSVKQDSSGNVYVLVRQGSDSTYGDYGLLKYSPGGNLLWSVKYDSPGNLDETPVAFDVSKAGDVYITGSSGINFVYNSLTVKYNLNGVLQWDKLFTGLIEGNDIAIDRQGNILLVGTSRKIVKYNQNGDTLWTRDIIISNYSNILTKLVIDDSSNVYATGYSSFNTQTTNYLTVKYNSSGSLIWYSLYGVTGYGALANSIAIDSNKNAYVVGVLNVPQPGFWDNVLIKINQNGILQWARNYTGINNNHSCGPGPVGLSFSLNTNTIYYSTICAIGNGSDIITLSYNTNGDTNWIRRYPTGIFGTPNSNPRDLKIDKYGNAYVAGSTLNSGVIMKYLNNGLQQWLITTDSSSGNSINLDSNQIFVTGGIAYNNITNAVTYKYNQIIGILPITNHIPNIIKLFQNYPNPFNSSTVITYSLPNKAFIELKIYNSLGQFVKSFINSEQLSNNYSVTLNTSDFASGVYFYSLIADEKLIETKKLIIIK